MEVITPPSFLPQHFVPLTVHYRVHCILSIAHLPPQLDYDLEETEWLFFSLNPQIRHVLQMPAMQPDSWQYKWDKAVTVNGAWEWQEKKGITKETVLDFSLRYEQELTG